MQNHLTKNGPTKLESLERDLHLRKLQVNHLLAITQAINENVNSKELMMMYKQFLEFEMEINRMILFHKNEKEEWKIVVRIGTETKELKEGSISHFFQFERLSRLENPPEHWMSVFDIVIPVKHKQEALAYVLIGDLANDNETSFSKVQFVTTITNVVIVAIENKRLVNKQRAQDLMRKEVELAGQMQLMLVPKSLPNNSRYELASIYKPKLGLGGDYYDFVELNQNKFVFCVGDIQGKGISAALFMANFQGIFHGLITQNMPLDQLIIRLNNSVFQISQGTRFVTFFIAEYDCSLRELRYVNAGHNRPLMAMNGSLQQLDKGTVFLGAVQELPSIEVGKIGVNSDAVILAFTDGLSDVVNAVGDINKEEYYKQLVLNHNQLSARDINLKLMNNLNKDLEETELTDDLTVLTCKINR